MADQLFFVQEFFRKGILLVQVKRVHCKAVFRIWIIEQWKFIAKTPQTRIPKA